MLSTMARRQAKTPVHGDLSGGAPALGGSNEEGGGSGAGQEGGKPARKPSARKPEQDGSEPPQKKSSVKEAGREGEKEEDTPGAAEGPSQLKCSLCSEDFSSSALLTDHMRSHASAPRPTSISATASVTAHTSPAKPFECPHSSCFKSFATFRGLCKHWEYEPTHRPPPTPTQPKLTSPPLARPSQLPSEPATQSEPTSPHVPIEGSPAQSPTSMPGSPSSRASMRFHSIIRTRRTSSNTEQMAEVGTKRSHSETSSPSALPSAKAMQLTSGERESVGTEDESVGGGEDEKKPHKGSHRPRTRSSSGPENPPTPVKSSFSSGDLSRSPRTRSSTAKASVEFAELPMRKKRKKRGRPRLVSKDSSAAAQDGHKKAKLEKTESKTESKEKAAASQELPATQPPVVKRKRGRPPKRKDPPPPAVPSTTGATTTVSTPARTTSASAVPPSPSSGKTTSSSASEGTKMKRSAVRQQDKSPAPSSESKGGARKRGSSSTLPPWESITDKEETSSSKAGSVQLHSLLSKSSDKEKELPELPAIQPSIVPPSGTSTAVAIPSILPQSHALSEAQANTPPNGATRSSSSSSAIDCSYVTMNKSMANSVVSSAGSDEQVRDGAATSKSRDDKEELEIIEVKRATRNVEIDLTKDEEVETAVSKGKVARRDSAGRREGAEEERGKPPPQQRPSSVIVNVLSSVGGAKGGDSKEAEHARLPLEDTDREEEKTEVRRRLSMDGMPTPPPLPPPQITPYPPGSTPTPTYSPYPYPMPYPPPPLMFPPGAPPYPYYGYPSVSQPHMPGAYIPSGPSMMPHPHAPPSHMEQTMEAMYSNTSAPVMTTVSGVRVSVLDKPPTHLSAVSPHQIPTASGRPRSTPGMYMDQQSPPVAMDMTRGPHPHPLSQTYRSGGMVPPGGPYFPPPQSYHNVSVRLDHSGVPYVDWGVQPPPHPSQRNGAEPPKPMTLKMESKSHPEEQMAPVECPECGRTFKNNKALNGHMRLHGGFDWTKKPYTMSGTSGGDGGSGSKPSDPTGGSSGASNEDFGGASSETDKHPPTGGRGKRDKLKARKRSRSRSHSPSPGRMTNKRRRSSRDSNPDRDVAESEKLTQAPVSYSAPKVFTFDPHKVPTSNPSMQDAGTMTGVQPHRNATLDDLCRAVEELERMENGRKNQQSEEQDAKRRPGNITIPQSHSSSAIEREKHRFGATPPYTPPPILSPARSMTMLASTPGIAAGGQPCTPSRILSPWTSRRSSDGRHASESEDSYAEPRINVGKDFQAVLPSCRGEGGTGSSPAAAAGILNSHEEAGRDEHKATKVWSPVKELTSEDEAIIDGYLELACSPAVLCAGRNKEMAMHVLHHVGGSVKEAVRMLLSGKSAFPCGHPMADYNYSGSRRWSARERQQFRRAWRVHRKQFHLIRSAVDSKRLPEVVEYYYTWKKYCSDEYRGRNRHISEEIVSDEDDGTYPQLSSTSSSASGENDSAPPPFLMDRALPEKASSKRTKKEKPDQPRGSAPYQLVNHQGPLESMYEHLPIVYAPHTPHQFPGNPVQQYKCKYPGCNQVFTSIFALNGHIRIHGGSFYPRKTEGGGGVASSASAAQTSSSTATVVASPAPHLSTYAVSSVPKPQHKPVTSVSAHQLELARALLELPQPRSPARSGGYSTPSPKPSPSATKAKTKKKTSSSSPGEREGYYPCNKCGRVFTKVKSRSAHMKSHIMKQS